jgi:hypothetical protein
MEYSLGTIKEYFFISYVFEPREFAIMPNTNLELTTE